MSDAGNYENRSSHYLHDTGWHLPVNKSNSRVEKLCCV